MAFWPVPIRKAMNALDFQYPTDELQVEAFAGTWGGLEEQHFLQAIKQNTDDFDTTFAIFALDALDGPTLVEFLASLLESPDPKIRWASAYCLGRRRDDRALPVLSRCLKEFLPPDVPKVEYDGVVYEDWFFADWRPIIRELLQEWTGGPV